VIILTKKLLIIISTGNKEKALAGLMYAKNAWAASWFDDIKIFFFGPSEKLILDDIEVVKEIDRISIMGESYACKAISEKQNLSKALENKGIKVIGVGPIISKFINQGYIPMVW
jgi:hypothetical protein